MKRLLCAFLCVAVGGWTRAQTAPAAAAGGTGGEAASPSAWFADAGVDFRLRYEAFEHVPQGVLLDDYSYIRFRWRPWVKFGTESVSVYARGAHRMHGYFDGNFGYRYPDEFIVDNLYLDVNGLFGDRVNLRLGRQDLMYGAGRVILEGTSGDGARSLYFDAVKAIVKLQEDTTLDVFGIYNDYENHLAIGHVTRDLNRYTGGFNKMREMGGGLYLKHKQSDDLYTELYYIWKREGSYLGNGSIPMPRRDVHTVGTRLLPKFNDKLSAELEVAGQWGEVNDGQHIRGLMAFAGLTYKLDPIKNVKPYVTGSVYYMSGDDSNNSTDHRWNPLWARYPQFSELTLYTFTPWNNGQVDGLWRWSNIIYPALEAGMTTSGKDKASLQTGPLFADESNGVDGKYRGWLASAKYMFPIVSNLLGDSYSGRGNITGTVYGECLLPGNYYASDNMAWFLRLELNATF